MVRERHHRGLSEEEAGYQSVRFSQYFRANHAIAMLTNLDSRTVVGCG